MKKLILIVAVVAVVSGIIWYALNTAPEESEQLIVSGSGTMAPLMQKIVERYQSAHPKAQIVIQVNDSLQGIADVRQGTADIGMISRDPAPAEKDMKWFTLGRDGLAVMVHAANPVTALTNQQIVAIFTGKITRWDDAGGNDTAIETINTAEGSSALAVFLNHFGLKSADLANGLVTGYNEQVIRTVGGNPNAIGYASLSIAQHMIKLGTAVKLLPLNSVTATTENVRRGLYPMVRTLNLVTRFAPQGLAHRFIDYAVSREAAQLIQDQGFTPAAR